MRFSFSKCIQIENFNFISTIQVFLKIAFPLIMFTPFIMGSWKLLFIWGVSYTSSLIIPWLMMISRSICNIVLIHSLNIEKSAATLASDPSYLKIGIDFSAASNMLQDTGRFLNTYLTTENGLWGSMVAIIPIVSWFAQGGSGQSSSLLGKSFEHKAKNMAFSQGVKGLSQIKTLTPSGLTGKISKKIALGSLKANAPVNKNFLKNMKG